MVEYPARLPSSLPIDFFGSSGEDPELFNLDPDASGNL